MVLTKDYLYPFRNNCNAWRREKWYWIHVYLNTVISIFLISLLVYRANLKGWHIPFSFTGIMGVELLNYTGVTIVCAYIAKPIDDLNKFMFDNFEDYASRGEKVHRKIQKIAGYFNWLSYSCHVSTVIIFCIILNSELRNNKFLYIFMLLDTFDLNPILYWIFFCLYVIFLFNMCIITVTSANLLPYFVFHCTLQYILLIEGVESLRKPKKNDEKYQNYIKKELKKIIKQTQILARFHYEVDAKNLRLPLFMLLIILAFCLVFVYLMSFFVQSVSEFILIFGECMLQFSALSALAALGQYYTNQTDELWYSLLKCPWYEWNIQNKRSFHIVLSFFAKREPKVYCGIIPLTHDTIVLLGRRIMAAITFVGTVGTDYFN